jgi:hypothetical protein
MAAPNIQNWTPTGASEDPDVNITFEVFDSDADQDPNTIDLDLTGPSGTVSAIVNGAFQPGYNGTISTGAGAKTTFVTLSTHPLFEVGAWQADVYVEDALANSDTQNWGWTVIANAPTITNQSPLGVTTGTLEKISCVLGSDWGLDMTSLSLTLTDPVGVVSTAISGGAFQTGFSGVIVQINDAGDGPKIVEIIINTWPDLTNGALYTFSLSIDDAVGQSL